jgi:hypothetical protein
MALVQAYRRNKTYIYAFADKVLEFQPNAQGDVVCDVQDPAHVARLLQVPTGFRLYGEQADEPVSPLLTDKVELVPAESSPNVLKDEASGIEFDLRPLTDDELHAFAKANDVKVHPKAKGDTIRDKIVQSFKE